jgi:hypothetical protein
VLGNSLLMNTLIEQGEGDDGEFTPSYIDMENENMNDFIISFEEGLDKKKKVRKKGLEKFIEEEIEPDDQNSDIG